MAASMSTARNSVTKAFTKESATFEQEQDANSALSDLDRGLRSMKVGVQCESVVRFPRLFEKYPFPILINSAFLRLADIFRAGNNFIRWCILRVTQQSEKHLDKILNVDEFMRRIFTVYHSNDPVARALTLRTLGSISMIISERKNIHHSVMISLDSHDAVEVDAAIFAAEKFSEQSRVFAANICDKISEMINNIATPVDSKLSLIPVLQHMHHDVAMANKARNVCLSLLSNYQAEKFITLTITTMSRLSALSLIDIPAQIDLLLTQLQNDKRTAVKVVILQQLHRLARNAPHLWTYRQVQELCQFVQSVPYTGLKVGTLKVLTCLSKSVAFKIFFTKQDFDGSLLDVCNLCYVHEDATLVATAIEFYTHLAIAYSRAKSTEYWGDQNLLDGAMTAIQTQTLIGVSQAGAKERAALKLCLKCAVELVKSQPKTAEPLVTCISSLLSESNGKNDVILCECLAAIGSVGHDVLSQSCIPQLLGVLQSSIQTDRQLHQLQVYLCTVVFQVASGQCVPPHVCDLVLACCGRGSPWLAYKTARQALRYGQCQIAEKILASLAQKVSSEHFYFWLVGLRDVSSGEACLQGRRANHAEVVPSIWEALTHYHKGLNSLKAAVTPSFPLQFQCEYVQLRASLLEVHGQLICTCNTFRTCPPPAIASALAMANGQEISRCGQIVPQLSKCGDDYDTLSESFATLYKQSFDADPATLRNVVQLQLACELMKLAVSSITLSGQAGQALLADKMMVGMGDTSAADGFALLLFAIHKELSDLLQTVGMHVITYKHTEFLSQSAARLAVAPTRFPRYFFQSLQQTSLKLAISPQQSGSEPVLIQNDTHLTLKVEGVIQHGCRPGLFRKIHSISINVTSSLISKPQANVELKSTDITVNDITETVEPHNDYFTVSFILGFPIGGLHSVSIEASIVDSDGSLWNTGPKVGLQVKSYDDAIRREQAKHAAQRPSYSQLLTS